MILAEDWFFKKLFSAEKVQAAQLKKRKIYMEFVESYYQFNFKHRIPIFLFLWDMNLESAIWQVQMIWFFISISSQAAESIMKAL